MNHTVLSYRSRTDSINIEMKGYNRSHGMPLYGFDPQKRLFQALQEKNFTSFEELLKSGVNPDQSHDYTDYKTCLDIACSTPGCSSFVKLLLEKNVDINKYNSRHEKAPIHFAAEIGDLDIFKTLLTEHSNISKSDKYRSMEAGVLVPTLLLNHTELDVSAVSGGANTALHLAIKQLTKPQSPDDNRDKITQHKEIIKLLLHCNSDVNQPDSNGNTPIMSAAKGGLEYIVKLIVKSSKKPVDLDSYKDENQRTARMIIEETFPFLKDKLPPQHKLKEIIELDMLFSHLDSNNEQRFIADFYKIAKSEPPEFLEKHTRSMTLLQTSCDNGLEKVTKILLENGSKPNLTTSAYDKRPIEIACWNGYHEILKILLNHDNTSLKPSKYGSLIQIIIKEAKLDSRAGPKRDYKKCLHILLTNPKLNMDINYIDSEKNSALHYAVRSRDQEMVLTLLKNGACIGMRNVLHTPPLADISAKTLESYLDNCLTTNKERPDRRNYEIKFNYSFLAPPRNIPYPEHDTESPLVNDAEKRIISFDRFLAPETDPLLYMTQHSELKLLLKHPIIKSFLYLKWLKIRCLFYANITLYAIFCLSLLINILCVGETEIIVYIVTRILTIIGLILLIIRELLQIAVSPKAYIKNFENLLQLFFIGVTAAIVVFNMKYYKPQLSAVAVFLLSAELFFLIGKFPCVSTYNEMLKTALWNFFKCVICYICIVLAFSLSVYILFRADSNFALDLKAFPILRYIMFVLFVFTVPIVLFNLLNSLTVSDAQAIKANSEILEEISRIKLISYYENIILGDLRQGQNCLRSRMISLKPLVKTVCLFPNFLPLAQITVMPNQSYTYEVYRRYFDDYYDKVSEGGFGCLGRYYQREMDKNIVKAAMTLIEEREERSNEMKQLKDKLLSCERKIENLVKYHEGLLKLNEKQIYL